MHCLPSDLLRPKLIVLDVAHRKVQERVEWVMGCVQVPYAVGGSGSAYISGFYEKYWEAGMTEEKCIDFCKRAVAHAFARDSSSGGCVRYVVITEQGARQEFVPHTDTLKCHGEVGVPAFAGFAATA